MENVSDNFPQPNFAGSSPPISPKTSPTSLWKSLVLNEGTTFECHNSASSRPKTGNDRQMTTSLPGHHWEATVALAIPAEPRGESFFWVGKFWAHVGGGQTCNN